MAIPAEDRAAFYQRLLEQDAHLRSLLEGIPAEREANPVPGHDYAAEIEQIGTLLADGEALISAWRSSQS